MPPRTIQTILRAAFFLGLALFVVFWAAALVNYFQLGKLALSFPYTIDYGEGPLLDQVMRLAAGENIYRDSFSNSPYTISNYPPVYLLAQVPFYWAAGPAFWYGRLISLVSALLSALFIGMTLYTLTRDRVGALVGAALLLAFPYIQFWSLLDRIDLLALALSWAGIFVLVRYHMRRWGLLMAGLLLTAAIFTRQTYALAAPGAAFFWLLLTRRPKQAFQLAAAAGGISFVLYLLIDISTHGGFYRNIVSANVNPFFWNTVRYQLGELIDNSGVVIALIVIFIAFGPRGEHKPLWSLALPYLVFATFSAITIGKDGSNVNYLLELTAALCFGAGAALARVKERLWIRLAFILALVFQLMTLNTWTSSGYNVRITEKTNQEMQLFKLFDLIRKTDGIILADEDMGLISLAGKRLYYQPFEYKMLSEGGLWDQDAFLEEIKEKRFSLILHYQPTTWQAVEARWTPEMRSTIPRYYQLEKIIGDTRIYRPKD